MGGFRAVRLAARIIYQLSGIALIAAVVALIVSGWSLAVVLAVGAVAGWLVAQILARIAVRIAQRHGYDAIDLHLEAWRE